MENWKLVSDKFKFTGWRSDETKSRLARHIFSQKTNKRIWFVCFFAFLGKQIIFTPLWSWLSWSRQGFSSSQNKKKMGVTNLLGLWKGVWLTSYSGLLMPLTRRAPIIGNSTFFFNGYKRVCHVNRRFKSKVFYTVEELYNMFITLLLLSTKKSINKFKT